MALPGVTTVLQDTFYTLSKNNVPSGPNVVVIGTRLTADGTNGVPSLTPFSFSNESDVISSFGYSSALHRGYLECVAGGAQSIILLSLPLGTQDSDLANTGPGNVVDEAFDASLAANPTIIVPWGRGGHPNEWTSPAATPDYPPASPAYPPPMGFQADNSPTPQDSLAVRIANKMAHMTSEASPVFAVMGLTPYVGTGLYATEVPLTSQLVPYLQYPNLIAATDSSFNGTAPYLSVVSTEIRPVTYNLSYGYSNGACLYAAALSQLASFNAPTGQPVPNITSLRWNPTRSQQAALSALGLVPVALNFNRTPMWVDAPTFASPTSSDFSRLTTLRIVFDAVTLVRQAAVPFVGKGSTLANRTSLETAVSSALRNMQLVGAVLASDYTVTYSPASNSAEIDLVLTPAFEMRNITISVSVNLG